MSGVWSDVIAIALSPRIYEWHHFSSKASGKQLDARLPTPEHAYMSSLHRVDVLIWAEGLGRGCWMISTPGYSGRPCRSQFARIRPDDRLTGDHPWRTKYALNGKGAQLPPSGTCSMRRSWQARWNPI